MKKFNKVIILTVAVLASVFSTSCSKDDDGGSLSNEEKIEGKWTYVSSIEKKYVNGVFDSEEKYELDEDEVDTIDFKSDGTYFSLYSYSGGSNSAEGKYWFDGDILNVHEDGEDEDDVYSVELKIYSDYFIVYDSDKYEENGDSIVYEYETRYERID
ncbi:lipocalin family protein [Tamlana sp. I1]|uniref:lipocalin family protein n=1 Tax=Tamlana sp. I1 TaxID=2762061 RepID=UPI00188E248C|nr:lipocalin family protein [Tamlana sp. I1]